MNYKSHALEILAFVNLYAPMWKEEIMNEYPETIGDYPKEWIDLLDSLSEKELFDVDCKRDIPAISGSSFREFVQTIKKLTDIPKIPYSPELPLEMWAFHGVKRKKKHEIQKIVPVLKELRDQKHFDYVVDIGGGVGHLSRVLSHYHQIPSISIDQNSEFQAIGKERLQKFRKLDGARDVTFMNLTFGKKEDQAKLQEVFHEKSVSLGLHTCGALANKLIQNTIDHKSMGLLNFGCCYYRMTPNVDFPTSAFYKDQNFTVLNLFGMSLATRSHAAMEFETYRTKERVKNYRYALHLFLLKHYNNKYATDVGECPIQTYWRPFHEYIRSRLVELKISHEFSDSYFDEFYAAPDIQRELRVMFLCNIIRWQLGRALEVYIQLDRAIYLEEQGYTVKLEQYFDEELSPRNLGILAVLI